MNALFDLWRNQTLHEQGLALMAMAMDYVASEEARISALVMSDTDQDPLAVVAIARGDKAARLLAMVETLKAKS